MLPKKLKNFLCHRGVGKTNEYKGQVAEVELPKLQRKLESYRGGGMDGEVKVDLGQEPLEMTIKTGGHMTDLYRDFGKPGVDTVPLRFSGAYQQDDTCSVQAVEIYARGRLEEIDPGSAKNGDDTEQSFKYALSYYRLTVDGEDIIEIDIPNMICKVDGEDVLSKIREAIGLFA